MRRNISLSVVIAFALGFFLASCSGFHQMEIDKRHYRNGFYIHHAGNSANNVSLAENPVPATANGSASVAMNEDGNSSANVVNPVSSEKSALPALPKPAAHKIKIAATPGSSENSPANNVENSTTATQTPLIIHHDHSAESDGTLMMILMIILCLTLCPIPILVKEGATKRFWIDLICWAIGVGILFGGLFYGGGFFLFAAVYALLIYFGAI